MNNQWATILTTPVHCRPNDGV